MFKVTFVNKCISEPIFDKIAKNVHLSLNSKSSTKLCGLKISKNTLFYFFPHFIKINKSVKLF